MSHTFADYGDRNILTPGCAGPGMAGDVMGQGNGQAQLFPNGLQISVDTMGGIDILLPLIHTRLGDDGKKVRGLGNIVTAHDLLHARLPFYKKLLPGFLPPVREDTVSEILLP